MMIAIKIRANIEHLCIITIKDIKIMIIVIIIITRVVVRIKREIISIVFLI